MNVLVQYGVSATCFSSGSGSHHSIALQLNNGCCCSDNNLLSVHNMPMTCDRPRTKEMRYPYPEAFQALQWSNPARHSRPRFPIKYSDDRRLWYFAEDRFVRDDRLLVGRWGRSIRKKMSLIQFVDEVVVVCRLIQALSCGDGEVSKGGQMLQVWWAWPYVLWVS